jgi:epoxyqueuosine reductase QueG
LYFDELFGAILPILREKYPQNLFATFADNSPIDEREAAAMAGLGIIGDNMMLITEKYSSYVFLGEIITDLPVPEATAQPIKRCEGCGACLRACPKDKMGECLSSLTQKKGELNENEKNAIKTCRSVWGCDICQEVCPHTKAAIKNGTIYTPVDFFRSAPIPVLTLEALDAMSDEEFSMRAYSWRGRDTIRRNLLLTEEHKNNA